MPAPLIATETIFQKTDQVRKFEYLPIPNITADYHLNHGGETLLQAVVEMWDNVVGLLRLRGLYKAYRTSAQGRPATGYIAVPRPETISHGETFTISDGVNAAKVFEFRKTAGATANEPILLTVVAGAAADAVTDTDVMNLMIQAINAAAPLAITAVTAAVINGMPAGNELFLTNDTLPTTLSAAENQNVAIADTVLDERFTHEGMAGALHRAAVGRLNIPAKVDLVDGETFTIPGVLAKTYEFDTNGLVTGGNVVVGISAITTDVQVELAVRTAINTQTGATGVTATNSAVKAAGYITALHPDLLVDGDSFTLNDGVNAVTIFEYDKLGNGVGAGRVPINISASTTMQAVRAATVAAINGVGGTLAITASTTGYGPTITLVNDTAGATGNQAVVSTVQSTQFLSAGMTGGSQSCKLTQSNTGTAYNGDITENVTSTKFSATGMAGGMDAGWDISDGHCAFQGYDIFLVGVPRLPVVVGKENFIKVRVTEERYTLESDPSVIKVNLPGVLQTLSGPNQIRWDAEVVLVAADALAPQPATSPRVQTRITEAVLAQPDSVNGQTLIRADSLVALQTVPVASANGWVVANSTEIPVRVRKFGVFVEPIDFSLVVLKTGSSAFVASGGITGQVTIAPTTPTHDALRLTGNQSLALWAQGGVGKEAIEGRSGVGGAASILGDSSISGSGVGVRGKGGATTNDAGVEGTGGGTGAGLLGLGTGASAAGLQDLQGVLGVGGTGNKFGVEGRGSGTAAGVRGLGGGTNGTGVHGDGTGTGPGVKGVSSTTSGSAGVRGEAHASVTNAYGLDGQGKGNLPGVRGFGGTAQNTPGIYGESFALVAGPGLGGKGSLAGPGVLGTGGATNGPGVRGIGGGTNGKGGEFSGVGTGEGLFASGGENGGPGAVLKGGVGVPARGAEIYGGVDGGEGLYVEALDGNNAAVVAQGFGDKEGVRATGGATGVGVDGTGGATSGVGVRGTGKGATGFGVEGLGSTTAAKAGVRGVGRFGAAPGVEGDTSGSTGPAVKGNASFNGAVGVRGLDTALAEDVIGVWGSSGAGTAGVGILADAGDGTALKTVAGSGAVAALHVEASGSGGVLALWKDGLSATQGRTILDATVGIKVGFGGDFVPAANMHVRSANPLLILENASANHANAGELVLGTIDAEQKFRLRHDAADGIFYLENRRSSQYASVFSVDQGSEKVKFFQDGNAYLTKRGGVILSGQSYALDNTAANPRGRVLEGCHLFHSYDGGAGVVNARMRVRGRSAFITSGGRYEEFSSNIDLQFVTTGARHASTDAGSDFINNEVIQTSTLYYCYLFSSSSGGVQLGMTKDAPDTQGRAPSAPRASHPYFANHANTNNTIFVGTVVITNIVATGNSSSAVFGSLSVNHLGRGLRRVEVPGGNGLATATSNITESTPGVVNSFNDFSLGGSFPMTAKWLELSAFVEITYDASNPGERANATILAVSLTGPYVAGVSAAGDDLAVGASNGSIFTLSAVTGSLGFRHGLAGAFASGTLTSNASVKVYAYVEDVNDPENFRPSRAYSIT